MFQIFEHQQASLYNKHQQIEEPSQVSISESSYIKVFFCADKIFYGPLRFLKKSGHWCVCVSLNWKWLTGYVIGHCNIMKHFNFNLSIWAAPAKSCNFRMMVLASWLLTLLFSLPQVLCNWEIWTIFNQNSSQGYNISCSEASQQGILPVHYNQLLWG